MLLYGKGQCFGMQNARGHHMEEVYSIAGLMTVL